MYPESPAGQETFDSAADGAVARRCGGARSLRADQGRPYRIKSGRILKNMKPWRNLGRALASGTVTVLIIVLAPAVLLFGELVNRHYLGGLPPGRDRILMRRRGLRRCRVRVVVRYAGPGRAAYAMAAQDRKVARRVLANPLWIALTAPARWLFDRLRPWAGGRRGRGGNGPPDAGIREPRRPLPDLPAGAMALPEPGPFD
jgi:hypothetical protein